MAPVTNFIQHRADGRAVPEGMTVADMNRRGWPAAKIVRITWDSEGVTAELFSDEGLLGLVVEGRRFVAVIGRPEPVSSSRGLFIVNADGSLRHAISHRQKVAGREAVWSFLWFETPAVVSDGRFGAAFEFGGRQRRIEFDAASGAALLEHEMR